MFGMEYVLKQRKLADSLPITINLNEDEIIVGRQATPSLIKFTTISRRHACFQKTESGIWFVKDLGSTNGLYVNGLKIGKSLHELKTGDVIGFGIADTEPSLDAEHFICELTVKSLSLNVKKEPVDVTVDEPVVDISAHDCKNSTSETNDSSLERSSVSGNASSSAFPKSAVISKSKPIYEDESRVSYDLLQPSCSKSSLHNTGSDFGDKCLNDVLDRPVDILKTSSLASNQFHADNDNNSNLNSQQKYNEELCRSKTCFVSLIKCDSEEFQWPPDVKKICLRGNISKGKAPCISNHATEFSCEQKLKRKRIVYVNLSSDDENTVDDSPSCAKQVKPGSVREVLPASKELTENVCSLNEKSGLLEANFSDKTNILVRAEFYGEFSTNAEVGSKVGAQLYSNQDAKFCHDQDVRVNKELGTKVSFQPGILIGSAQNTKVSSELNANISSSAELDENKNLDDEEPGYSQVEEVIVISDDDLYLDFSSSQKAVNVKIEPVEDPEDIDLKTDSEDEAYKEIFSGDSFGDVNVQNKAAKSSDGEDVPESLEKIKEFMNATPQTTASRNISSAKLDEGSNLRLAAETNDYFPKLSQDFDEASDEKSDSSIHSDYKIIYPSHSRALTKSKDNLAKQETSSFNTKRDKKAVGKTLLTEPKPMSFRPRKVRGREEWFNEKGHSPEKISVQKKEQEKKYKIPKKVKSPEKAKKLSPNSHPTAKAKKIFIKNDAKNALNNYRIPRITQPEEKRSKVEMSGQGGKRDISNENSYKMDAARKRAPTVKRRPDSYYSRGSFLTSSSNETTVVKRRPKQNMNVKAKIVDKTSADSKQVGKANKEFLKCVSGNIKVNQPPVVNKSISDGKGSNLPPAVPYNLNQESAKCISKEMINQKPDYMSKYHSVKLNDKSSVPTAVSDAVKPSAQSVVVGSYRDPRLNRRKSLDSNSCQMSNCSTSTQHSSFVAKERTAGEVGNTRVTTRSHSSDASYQKNAPKVAVVLRNSLNETQKNKTSLKVNFISAVTRIVNMNPSWLKEQKACKKPPPDVSRGATALPLCYESFDSYICSFYPMLMLEMWELMYQEYKTVYESKNVESKFYFSVLRSVYKHDLMELECESVVNEKVSYSPREGTLVILELTETEHREDKTQRGKNLKSCRPIFGYIHKQSIEDSIKASPIFSEWKKLPSDWLENSKLWTFSVYTKKKAPSSFSCKTIMKANGVCYIKSRLRLVDALNDLQFSKLQEDVFAPRKSTFHIKYVQPSPSREYSSCQKQAIQSISSEIRQYPALPKIILVQGPPGTGKTHTIVGLLENLIFGKKFNMKILVTAPSNAAVDEIGCRLIDLNERFSWRADPIKFVRVGQLKQIHPKILPYSLEEKASQMLKEQKSNEEKHRAKELEQLSSDINKIMNDPSKMEELKHLMARYDYLKKHSIKYSDRFLACFKSSIIKESNIILSTLSSCRQSVLTRIFKPNSPFSFSCCIVDEATQCTEPEILQPLMFGITKLVLVGDHQQLPATVNSKLAIECGFERSMFERIHLYFMQYHQESPIFTLTEQFRMHSEICHFPSKHFYEGKLITAAETDIKCEYFPLHPYIVLDILDGQESNSSSSKTNSNEALVIVNICSLLLQNKTTSIGIITPYQAQKTLYMKALSSNPNYKDIEVNTVDSFQGREKDVIIVSCVRANSPSGGIGFLSCRKRLNVAITRARKCLIVCGHVSSLILDPEWRALISDARERKLRFCVTSHKDIPLLLTKNLVKNS